MNIIFQVDGGLGKSIMATAMVKVIRKRYKNSNLIVVTAHPDIFLNNPDVNKVYKHENTNGFYLKYIKNQECKIFVNDPYRQSDFILDKPKSLYKTWCELFGLRYNNEQPQIYLTKPELDYFTPYYSTNKPILAIQTNGGPAGLGYQYAWTRDIPDPVILELIEHYKNDYTIIHIKREDQKIYPDTMQALDGYRSIAILLQLSSKRLLIDSFAQHMASSLNLPSTVCWIATKPEVFGYSLHDNIFSNPFTKEPLLEGSVYQPFNLSQDVHTIPYNDLKEVFDVNQIITSINNQK
jgi:ADP-heptose:LPS heptosyltransferase|tara:strand:- start:169 stop:1050 length:882 start_codon:yes stop_codon:yes gene_type:complete